MTYTEHAQPATNKQPVTKIMTHTEHASKIAEKLGFELTFQYNRAHQGAIHCLLGRDNMYPNDKFYSAGYEAGL